MSSLIRSILHMALMMATVIPYALVVVAASAFGVRGEALYRLAQKWLILAVDSAQLVIGIRYKVHGVSQTPYENSSAVIYLVKHQSTYETFLLPAILNKPVAYVFKRELLNVPFFGWAIGRLDMIHIDRTQRAKAFAKIVEQGQNVLAKGVSVIMFPEGTRINRGEKGVYKTGGARLAVETGASVIPVAVTSAKCWPKKAFIKSPGVVDISFGDPISSHGRTPEELTLEVETWIEREMRRLDPTAYGDSSVAIT